MTPNQASPDFINGMILPAVQHILSDWHLWAFAAFAAVAILLKFRMEAVAPRGRRRRR